MNAEELKELREVVGKAVGCDGPYKWGIEDYVAVAEHFKAKTLEWLAKQCGEKPCLTCKEQCLPDCQTEIWMCGMLYQWLGQQQGYAKAMQEKGK